MAIWLSNQTMQKMFWAKYVLMRFCILNENKLHTKTAWKLKLLIKLYFRRGLEYTFALNTDFHSPLLFLPIYPNYPLIYTSRISNTISLIPFSTGFCMMRCACTRRESNHSNSRRIWCLPSSWLLASYIWYSSASHPTK